MRLSAARIAAVKKSNPLTVRLADSEIARRALTAVRMPWMLEIADARRIALDIAPGDFRAAIARTVVDEKQFPIGICLRVNTGDGLVEESILSKK
jgi:hypothetical protein